MKQFETIFERGEHKWITLHNDTAKAGHLIATNEYIIQNGTKSIITDPGGTEVFPSIISSISELLDIEDIDQVFCSHQDPDIFSAVALWLQIKPELKIFLPKIWLGFMLHFAGTKENFELVPDEGATITLNGLALQAIPAHYLHSSGNFNLYDPVAKILFSGDLGAALMDDKQSIYVEDFEAHIPYMEGFHKRWIGSNEHKKQWVKRIRELDIDMICPQHGMIFRGENVAKFIDWLDDLKVGYIEY